MIYVIGAGWYGCHIALELLKQNYEVRIVDKANTFFTGSSSKNQNRLHLGYHYPRSDRTIAECQRGFAAFKAAYPTLCHPIPNNLYLLSVSPENRTDAHTFAHRFGHPGELLCVAGRTPFSRIKGVKPTMFPVAEEYIDHAKAAQYFRDALEPYFIYLPQQVFSDMTTLRHVLEMQRSTKAWFINCTYNQLDPMPMDHYELYCSLVYHIPTDTPEDRFALTIMDGPFFSLYPYDLQQNLYTLTSVQNGVVWRGTDLQTAPNHAKGSEEEREIVGHVRQAMEAEVHEVLPEFTEKATFISHFFAWKTKPASETDEDDRSLRMDVDIQKRHIRLYGGKITGIFDAAERVLECIGMS